MVFKHKPYPLTGVDLSEKTSVCFLTVLGISLPTLSRWLINIKANYNKKLSVLLASSKHNRHYHIYYMRSPSIIFFPCLLIKPRSCNMHGFVIKVLVWLSIPFIPPASGREEHPQLSCCFGEKSIRVWNYDYSENRYAVLCMTDFIWLFIHFQGDVLAMVTDCFPVSLCILLK